ncbi:MAG TPA: hypothetical protein VGI39_16495 [Polyangiaceae bacterium]
MGRPKRTSARSFHRHDETKLEALRDGVAKAIARHKSEFERLCAKEPYFASIPSADALLAPWLGAPATNEERAARLLSILNEYQRTRHALWSDALLVAAFPLLIALRRRLKLPRALRADGDALVLEAFYEEAARVKAADYGALGVLGRATARKVFAKVLRARASAAGEAAYVQQMAPLVTRPDLDEYVDLKRSLQAIADERGLASDLRVLPTLALSDDERDRRRERLKKRLARVRSRFRRAFAFAA